MRSLAEQYGAQLATTATDRELAALSHDWRFWGRPEQFAPDGSWSTWLILAGRGWGKTRTGAEAVREAVEAGIKRIALVGATASDVRDVMLYGESGLLAIFPEHERPKYEPSKRRVLFHTGAVATLYSAEKPDRLRGPQHELAWLDELAAWGKLDETLYNLNFGLRLGPRPRKIVTTTPRPLQVLRDWVLEAQNGSDVVVTRGATYDNAANLAPSFLDEVRRAYEGTRLGQQELFGEILSPSGSLFREEWFKFNPSPPPMTRIIVSVDPAITERSDETGIVVVGRRGNEAWVLEDLSGVMSPQEMAERAAKAVKKWKAHAIVAEVNRGGDMVRAIIRQHDTTTPVREVRAYKGKDARAEPVAALYEQGRVWHVQRFEKLERQMCEWDPVGSDELRVKKKARSPDRMDALVWGIHDLGFHIGLAPKNLAPIGTELPKTRF